MISTLNQVVDLHEVPKHSKDPQTLAKLTCSTGLNINIQSMKFSDGCWDVAVRTVGQDAIYIMRQQNTEILDVYGLGTTLKESKYLTENAIGLDYWYFFVAKAHLPIVRRMIFLVIPVWDSPVFDSHKLTEIITSVLFIAIRTLLSQLLFPSSDILLKRSPSLYLLSVSCKPSIISHLSNYIQILIY